MKKSTQKIIKLLDFLIRVLLKVVKVGTKTLVAIEEAANKGQKIAPIIVEIGQIIQQLQEKREKLSNISEG